MSDVAIRVDNLSKKYRIGGPQKVGSALLTEAVIDTLKSPLRGLRRLGQPPQPEEYIWALKDVSFEVRHGEVVGIIGRNGAGKSTLLKILSRITEPTQGRAEIYGRVGSLLEVGTGFHPELTGRENIYLNGTILGMRRIEINRKFDEIVDFAGVEKFIDTPIKRYSSGMQVRLAFAVAAHLEPEILLVDEVLAVGDLEFQKKCLGKMGEISREGRTVMMVSHNMGSILNLCPTSILLTKGMIELINNTREVVDHYISMGAATQGGQVQWDDPQHAPGNEYIRLHSVRVSGQGGTETDKLGIDEDIKITVGYWNFKRDASYIVNINLKDHYGSWVFTAVNTPSASTEPDPWFHRPQPVGLFETTCLIPGNFLNNNSYYVYIAVAERGSWIAAIQEEDIVSFTIIETGVMTKEYKWAWLGPVRPRLYWYTEFKGQT